MNHFAVLSFLIHLAFVVLIVTTPFGTKTYDLPAKFVLGLGWAGFFALNKLFVSRFLKSAWAKREPSAELQRPLHLKRNPTPSTETRWVISVQPVATEQAGFVSQLLFAIEANPKAGPPPADYHLRWLVFAPWFCQNSRHTYGLGEAFTLTWSAGGEGYAITPTKLKTLIAQHRAALTPLAAQLFSENYRFADLLPEGRLPNSIEAQVAMVQLAVAYFPHDTLVAYLERHPHRQNGLRGLLLQCATGLPLSPTERLVLLFHSFTSVRQFARTYLNPAGFQPHQDLAHVLHAPPSPTRRDALRKLLDELRTHNDHPSVPHLIALYAHKQIPTGTLLRALERKNDQRVFQFFLDVLPNETTDHQKHILEFFTKYGQRDHLPCLFAVAPALTSVKRHLEVAVSLIGKREPTTVPPGLLSPAPSESGSLRPAAADSRLARADHPTE